MQTKRIWIGVIVTLFAGTLHAQDISGDWQGRLQGKVASRLMLQIVKAQSSGWQATLYRIDQSGEPEQVLSIKLSGSDLKLSFGDGGTYEGKVSADAASIRGNWREGRFLPRPLTFQRATKQTAWQNLDSEADPAVTKDDMEIIERAKAILNSPARWNRADNRGCPKTATSFSLYCALDKATVGVSGHFEHRGAAMQEARFVIDDDLSKGNHYDHRLMDYNNDPKTTFADTQEFFRLLEDRIVKRLRK